MTKLLRKIVLASFMLMAFVPLSYAGANCSHCGSCDSGATHDHSYMKKASGQLVHGVGKVLTGWTHILREPYASMERDGQNMLEGLIEGLGKAGNHTVAGALQAVTFMVPGDGCHCAKQCTKSL